MITSAAGQRLGAAEISGRSRQFARDEADRGVMLAHDILAIGADVADVADVRQVEGDDLRGGADSRLR